MKITVSEKDIKLGLKTRVSNTKCPVARALRRAGFKTASVGVDWVATKYGVTRLPENAIAAISGMCRNEGMKPFSFNLTEKHFNILTGN